jgi:RNA polymerase sigma-70 factor (ECF subfamily)
LVAASRRGDKRAYGMLVQRYYRDVFAVCLGVVANVDDAEDVAQEVLLRGYLKIGQLRNGEQFGNWIMRIARNLSIDSLRRKKQLRVALSRRPGQPQGRPGSNHGLERAIRHLPKELRLPLVMYYFDSKNAKTISDKLNISHSAACQRIRTARQQLHELLTGEMSDER